MADEKEESSALGDLAHNPEGELSGPANFLTSPARNPLKSPDSEK
jgi:hypothetical protein